MSEGKNYFYNIFNLCLFYCIHFSVSGTEPLEETKGELDLMQNIAVNKYELLGEKKNAFELAEKEALEAENNVHAIKLEIEAIKVKGQFEETFLRFPHIAEQVFETLDIQSLSKCQEVSKCWQKFVLEEKPFFIQLENYTSIPKLILKKSLKNYDFQTIQKLAYCASISHKKAFNAIIPFGEPPVTEPKGPTLFYYILSEEKLNHTQLLLAKLMLLNKVKKPPVISTINNQQYQCQNQEKMNYKKTLFEFINDAKIGRFGKAYINFKKMIITQKGKCGSLWSWFTILWVAVAQNHLTIVKLMLEQVQDIHQLHRWEKNVLGIAITLGHRDMCEFILDKTQGVDLLVEKNWWGRSLIQMAESLGHKEICTLFESFMKKYK
jgi:hypothetical protein